MSCAACNITPPTKLGVTALPARFRYGRSARNATTKLTTLNSSAEVSVILVRRPPAHPPTLVARSVRVEQVVAAMRGDCLSEKETQQWFSYVSCNDDHNEVHGLLCLVVTQSSFYKVVMDFVPGGAEGRPSYCAEAARGAAGFSECRCL